MVSNADGNDGGGIRFGVAESSVCQGVLLDGTTTSSGGLIIHLHILKTKASHWMRAVRECIDRA
jgi:hypothetical protein